MLYINNQKQYPIQNLLFCLLSKRGSPKFWNILISPPSPAVTTTKPQAVEDWVMPVLLPLIHFVDGKDGEGKVPLLVDSERQESE